MVKRCESHSFIVPLPIEKKSKRVDKVLERLEKLRKIAIKEIDKKKEALIELGLDKPKLSLMEKYLESEIGHNRNEWLKSKGWIRTIPRSSEALVSYYQKIAPKHKIRIWKNHSITEFFPDKPKILHQSWESFIDSIKCNN